MQWACCFCLRPPGVAIKLYLLYVPCLFFVSFPVTKKPPFKAYDCLHSATSEENIKEEKEKVAVTKHFILHDYSAHNQANASQQ